ncbi:TIGR03943 family protein [Bacillus sp. MRMR6]|uniref:TIGR03943 family putative permease subunit n=1 Tax=Bacillus sp. MRMR6 TaxID=1928617 RepID=UPI0009527E4C|nr:TIGR03943 family protein [Bacillus sp. MRMR6]OLS37868.1 TIGR03943 family protein [Bacillus sp. MRMR6]
MKFHVQQAVRAFILLAFSALLFKMHYLGEMTKFINPKYELLSQIASILFLILFFIQSTRIWTLKQHQDLSHCHHDDHDHHCSHDHGDSHLNSRKFISYLIIILPLVTGFLLPAKVLDASIADKKGGMAVITNRSFEKKQGSNISDQEGPVLTVDPSDPSLLKDRKVYTKDEYNHLIQKLEQSTSIGMTEEVFSSYYEEIHMDVEKFKGREIKLTGFVYKGEGLQPNQLVLSRFLITHCVADASIIGFISELPEASLLEEDTWVEATGILVITTYDGLELPMIKVTEWKVVTEPKEPYLYPINVKVM